MIIGVKGVDKRLRYFTTTDHIALNVGMRSMNHISCAMYCRRGDELSHWYESSGCMSAAKMLAFI
jgi:hypothetical protein